MQAAPYFSADQFSSEDGELLINGLKVSRLAAMAGRTPFYAYDRSLIDARVGVLRRLLPAGVQLHYAMKANPMPALVGFMAQRVDGLDVASGGELRVALDAGMVPSRISFAGPGKSADELRQALAAGVLLNVESAREVELLADLSEACGWPARVAVRINPDFEMRASGMRMGGGAKPFGVDAEAVPALLGRIGELGLAFEGFHLYAGSQNLNADSLIDMQRRSFDLMLRLSAGAPVRPKTLNLGGGFGIPYFRNEQPLALEPVCDALAGIVGEARSKLPGAELVVELGRYLVGEAGVYICRVVDCKVSRGQTFVVVDGGMHHHLAASGNFGQVIRRNYPVLVANRMAEPATGTVSVVGPLCTPLDLLADKVELADVRPGDLVAVFQSGAYGFTASPLGFLGHPEPVQMLV
ncbi:MAG: pyridoxal-dependent decarboxylase, exosortase A system-associated [Methyloversatilis sp.]|nr:pyridoxal-dependent decarboxylase, exosortase A system-associated [Methyloversatilis sp.]